MLTLGQNGVNNFEGDLNRNATSRAIWRLLLNA